MVERQDAPGNRIDQWRDPGIPKMSSCSEVSQPRSMPDATVLDIAAGVAETLVVQSPVGEIPAPT
jgi:hypothetical protein